MRTLLYGLGLVALQACAPNAAEEAHQVNDTTAQVPTSTLAKFEP